MSDALREALAADGAVADPGTTRPLHFGDPAAELSAALETCVVADRSDLGRVLATGPDLLDLLHRLSTAAVKGLAAGQGRETVLTTPKGRIVERLFVHQLGEPGALLVAGPGGAARVIAHLDRFTFAEKTGLTDATGSWCQLALTGPRAADALRAAGLPVPDAVDASPADAGGARVFVLGHDGTSTAGFSVVSEATNGARLWPVLRSAAAGAGGRAAGDVALEAARVLRGLPAPGHELTEGHNPLEAGLWQAVDFDKGCYVGQEVVARLNTYDKVARAIKGFVLGEGSEPPAPGTALFAGDRPVGEVTSVVVPPGRRAPVGLAFVKRDFNAAGTELRIGDPQSGPVVRVRDLPLGDTP